MNEVNWHAKNSETVMLKLVSTRCFRINFFLTLQEKLLGVNIHISDSTCRKYSFIFKEEEFFKLLRTYYLKKISRCN